METLPQKPYSDRKLTTKYYNRKVGPFENGAYQVARTAVKASKLYELKFSGTEEQMEELVDFFDARNGGGEAFWWFDEKNNCRTVRIESDEIAITQKVGVDELGYGVKAFEVTVVVREEVIT